MTPNQAHLNGDYKLKNWSSTKNYNKIKYKNRTGYSDNFLEPSFVLKKIIGNNFVQNLIKSKINLFLTIKLCQPISVQDKNL